MLFRSVAEGDKNRGGAVVYRTQDVVIVRFGVEAELFDCRDPADAVGSVKYRVVDLIHHNRIPISGRSGLKSNNSYIIMISQTACKNQTAMLPKLSGGEGKRKTEFCPTSTKNPKNVR